jgi:hypothetical protein
MIRILLALVLICAPVWGQDQLVVPRISHTVGLGDILIVAPNTPIQTQRSKKLPVIGLSEQELGTAVLDVEPDDGVEIYPIRTWSNALLLDFTADKPGKYTVSITLNGFRQHHDNFLIELRKASAPPELLAKYETLANELIPAFPLKVGSCVVEVAGQVPLPPTVPPGPNPPTTPSPSKIDRVTYVWEKDQGPVPQGVAKALQRLNTDSAYRVLATDFEEDTIDGSDGQTPDQYVIALKAAREMGLPALVVQAGTVVVKVVKAPKTEVEVLDVVK